MSETNKKNTGTSCCCGDGSFDCNAMMEKMKGLMGGKDGSFDCESMMQGMMQMFEKKNNK